MSDLRREMWWIDPEGKEHHLTSLTYTIDKQTAKISEPIRNRLFALRDEREAWKRVAARLSPTKLRER